MSYPSYDQRTTSKRQKLDDLRIDRSTSGSAHGRALYTATKFRYTVAHVLTRTEAAALETHYDSNRAVSFAFTWKLDLSTATVLYESAPELDYDTGAPLVLATVALVQL